MILFEIVKKPHVSTKKLTQLFHDNGCIFARSMADIDSNVLFFRKNLMAWAAEHLRPMPWKGIRDPYRIWLSEVILQQTRVEQGLPYYEKFTARYPTVHDLAIAPEDEVLKLWEGLGYYSRARNMMATARYVANSLNGLFPDTYEGIKALRGIGDYTAAAIAAFAYDLPHAVLDGNVYRVLARYFGIDMPTDTPAAKRHFAQIAQQMLDRAQPGAFNQAMMDFGATHCTPQQPKCATCPLTDHCVAFQTKRVGELPVRIRKPDKKKRIFLYAVIRYRGNVLIRKRQAKDIWQNLYEFPMLEISVFPEDNQSLADMVKEHFFGAGPTPGVVCAYISGSYRQALTHQLITAVFCEFDVDAAIQPELFEKSGLDTCTHIQMADLKKNIAVPRVIAWYLQEKATTLSLF
jgi:A/G-specific adenine glycosylase